MKDRRQSLRPKERRQSPRTTCSFSLTYHVLREDEFEQECEDFPKKRKRIALYDQLVYENKKQDFKIKAHKNDVTPYLASLNTQMRLMIETLSLDYDVLHKQEVFNVVINLGGMLFHSKDIIEPGKIVELQLRLSIGKPRILILAEVIKSYQSEENDGIDTIVSFTFIEPEDKVILEKYTEQQVRKGAVVV